MLKKKKGGRELGSIEDHTNKTIYKNTKEDWHETEKTMNNRMYMHNPAPVLENATHELQWDFNIQTDHLIPARRPDLIIINKKTLIYKRNLIPAKRLRELAK